MGLLDALETTPMTKSYKMLVLLAMLQDADSFPGSIGIDELADEVQRLREPDHEGGRRSWYCASRQAGVDSAARAEPHRRVDWWARNGRRFLLRVSRTARSGRRSSSIQWQFQACRNWCASWRSGG